MSFMGSRQLDVQRFLARHRRNRFISRAAAIIEAGYHNADHNLETNGELDVIHSYARGTVFDVGANRGAWTAQALAHAVEIHAFEIVESTARIIESRYASDSRVITNAFGLSDEEGNVSVSTFPDSELASLVVSSRTTTLGRVTTGDAYCETRGIDHIDLLKIDTEGAEMKVLRGFKAMLDRGAIGAIQFEYGQANILAGVLLKDLYEALASYRIGKVYPAYVDFRPYALEQEDFRGPNYLAEYVPPTGGQQHREHAKSQLG